MIHRTLHRRVLVLTLAAGLVVAACGGGSTTSDDAGEPMATESDEMDDGMDMGDDEEEDGHGDDGESFAFGHPAEESDADRAIEIQANDSFRFSPDAVQVAAGETVTFVVENVGKAVHEFVIGDEHTQDEHAAEMEEMGSGMEMHDEPNAISIDPGETKRLTWTFTSAGEVLYGCHEPGHYQAGMVGTVNLG